MNFNDTAFEALDRLQKDDVESDREQAYILNELREEPHYIVKEMMGETYVTFFEDNVEDTIDVRSDEEIAQEEVEREKSWEHTQDQKI